MIVGSQICCQFCSGHGISKLVHCKVSGTRERSQEVRLRVLIIRAEGKLAELESAWKAKPRKHQL